MILAPGGRSTWGWKQNAMITVDPATGKVTLNPEFYVMKHVTRFVDPGAVRLGLAGEWTGNTLAFRNPSGRRVVVAHNPFAKPAPLAIAGGCRATLPPHSFNTFCW
jgi:glucosylceramidase